MGNAIAIDLGTTLGRVAIMDRGTPVLIDNIDGLRLTPCVVAIDKSGDIVVGQGAKRQAVLNPDNTIYSIKRFMGRKFGEPAGRGLPVEEDARRKSYKINRGSNNEIRVTMGRKEYRPEDISAIIVENLKRSAEAYIGETVSEAVVTVPSYFNHRQRQATKEACEIAGLKVLRIISESTAAALAYGLLKKKDEIVAIYHLGGGTFDISIVEVGGRTLKVRSTCGDTHLGGDDFDERIIDWIVDDFRESNDIDLRNDKTARQRLKEAAEKAKCELSTVMQTEINLQSVAADEKGTLHLNMTLTRDKLEHLVTDLVEKTARPCIQALEDAGLSTKQIQEVILVGGQTRMPLIQQKVKQIFGKEPNKSVNPDEVVVMGAAIQCGVLKGEVSDALLIDVTPLTLGVENAKGVMIPIIQRNTTIPTCKSQEFMTDSDGQTRVAIHVLQGERAMAAENSTLGRFILDDLVRLPRGALKIDVSFDMDANGILSVKAHDKYTGKEQKIVVVT